MATKLQIRRDSASDWTSANPVLSAGEIGYEQDTSKMKVGDGSTAWTSLAYFSPSASSTSDLSEGTNLYFTDARADARIAAASTSDLSEGTNLYFTDARADARIAAASTSSGVTVVANMTALVALTGMSAGDQAFVTANNRLFLYNGSGWYLVATVQNNSPSAITGVSNNYALATDGTAATITAVSTDPEGAPLTWSYAVTTGSLTNGGGATATVSQADNVFTITPTTNTSYAGTFSITFSATDGVSGAVSAVSAFTLTFAADWSSVSQQAKIQSSDIETGDQFGVSTHISTDGNTVVVGAQVESTGGATTGSTYIFTRSGTTWSQQAKLQPSDVAAGDASGAQVSISGDGNTLVLSSPGDDTGYTGAGAAYIFTRSGTTWSQQQKLVASTPEEYGQFGRGVGISTDGNTVVVGAPGEDTGAGDTGAVYVFIRSGTTWSQQQKIQHSDRAQYDALGEHVAVSSNGNDAIISARQKSGGGAAYVFTRSGTTWSQQAKIVSSDLQDYDSFGADVDISDNGATVIVGADAEDSGGSAAGAAYIFTRSGTTWSQQQKIQASDIQAGDFFGIAVALDTTGDLAIVGSYREDTDYSNAGAAYVFTRDGTTWSEESKITPTDSARAASDGFGNTVAISSDTAIVGGSGVEGEGAAYIFTA